MFEDQRQLEEIITIKKEILKKKKNFGEKYLNIILAINNFVNTFED